MPNRLKFTKRALDQIEHPTDKQREIYFDEIESSLALFVTSGGSKTFYVYKWLPGSGRARQIRLDRFPNLSVDDARRQAGDLRTQIAAGKDPLQERQLARAEWTFAQLFAEWLIQAKERKRTWKEDVRQYNSYLLAWRTWQLSRIRRADVVQCHRQIGQQHGPYTANRALALIRAMFNFAINQHELPLSNPAKSVKAFPEVKRSRRMLGDEVIAFLQALELEPNEDIREFLLLALFTGARRSNLLSARWDEMHLDQQLWIVPGVKSKNKSDLQVQLPKPAVEILQRRKGTSTGSMFVFPGTGRHGHLVEPKEGWKRILKRAGITDLRLHDLRRTFASFQIDAGASLEVVGKTLGHQSLATTQIYARLSRNPLLDSVERAIALMVNPKSNVTAKELEENDGTA